MWVYYCLSYFILHIYTYRPTFDRHLLIREKKPPPQIVYIEASTADWRVLSYAVVSPSYTWLIETERDILRKMNISNNSKMFLEACLVSFVVRSPPPSYIRNNIAAIVVNIVLAIAGTILNSFVLFIFGSQRNCAQNCHISPSCFSLQ